MTTVSAIATSAFDAVAAAFSDVVQVATITYETEQFYNTVSGKSSFTGTTITGRAVIGTASAIAKSFPAYTAGDDDVIISLEGFTTVPKVGWFVTIGDKKRTIKAVGDIVGVGTFFEVVAA